MRCNTCGDYIAKGKKFNARKETVEEETYLGLKVFRFYFKCPRCMAEITFKTDPKNMDYEVEHGATPNFKALKLAEQQAQQEAKEKEEDEKLNPMKLLENRTKASRREMENLEALEDLREINMRQVSVNYEDLVKQKEEEMEEMAKKQEEEDEAFVRSIFPKAEDGGLIFKDLPDPGSSSDEDDKLPSFGVSFLGGSSASGSKSTATDLLTEGEEMNERKAQDEGTAKRISSTKRKLEGLVRVVKKKEKTASVAKSVLPTTSSSALSSLVCAYSDSESDSAKE
jgi:hypothetical protein